MHTLVTPKSSPGFRVFKLFSLARLVCNDGTKSAGKAILIVEDDADLRRVWRWALWLDGFDVREAADGIDALNIIEQHLPDLVILDLGLPKLGGVSVLQEIAAQSVTRRIPVVVVTASTEVLDHLDAACVLRKPVAPESLVAVVRRCLVMGAPESGVL